MDERQAQMGIELNPNRLGSNCNHVITIKLYMIFRSIVKKKSTPQFKLLDKSINMSIMLVVITG